jgi:methionine synthase II (cobalamin-independent)
MVVTHTGSLPRSPELTDALVAERRDVVRRSAAVHELAADAVRQLVSRQVECGVDLITPLFKVPVE